jgi:hypothetical protein
MKKAFLQKVIYRQMVANIFSEEYIFFPDFLNHFFLLGIVLKNVGPICQMSLKRGLKNFHALKRDSRWRFFTPCS